MNDEREALRWLVKEKQFDFWWDYETSDFDEEGNWVGEAYPVMYVDSCQCCASTVRVPEEFVPLLKEIAQ